MESEILLLDAIASSANRSQSCAWREMCASVACLRLMSSTMRYGGLSISGDTASALESSVAISIRREMLESLTAKLSSKALQKDLMWPKVTSPPPQPQDDLNAYWHTLHGRYTAELKSGLLTTSHWSSSLPQEWVTLSLHLSLDERSILAVRYQGGRAPLTLQLPIDRVGSRESEEELLTFATAKQELSAIVAANNHTAQRAKMVQTKDDRITWWKSRKVLEDRLHHLLQGIEERWFGGFKVRHYNDLGSLLTLLSI